jgi:ATP-independent RNA helicase DbpA
LTGEGGIPGSEVGKINVFEFHTYVAIRRGSARAALACLSSHKIKGRFFKIRPLN